MPINMLFFYALISGFLISMGSLVGILTLSLNHQKLHKFLLSLVSLSAGSLIGGAFLHLLPEAGEMLGLETIFYLVIIAYITFFMIESFLHWHHCHDDECETHSFGYMNLVGDSVHNFIDGLVIASAFITDLRLGIITTLAVALHEIPQEISDFGVLLHAGFKVKKALILNFLVAMIIIPGILVGFLLTNSLESVIPLLLPFAAGGFIYIASSDLIPQIINQKSLKKSIVHLFFFVLGICLMYTLKFLGVK